jgi:hypothetical protein
LDNEIKILKLLDYLLVVYRHKHTYGEVERREKERRGKQREERGRKNRGMGGKERGER